MNWPHPSIIALLLLAQVSAACDSTKVLSMEQTNVLLKGPIQVGASREDIINQLGEPYKQERHGATEFLFYQTVWQVTEKAATRSPIALIDGKVVGLGKAHYDKVIKQLADAERNDTQKQGWSATVNP
jgi:hypothetical protein